MTFSSASIRIESCRRSSVYDADVTSSLLFRLKIYAHICRDTRRFSNYRIFKFHSESSRLFHFSDELDIFFASTFDGEFQALRDLGEDREFSVEFFLRGPKPFRVHFPEDGLRKSLKYSPAPRLCKRRNSSFLYRNFESRIQNSFVHVRCSTPTFHRNRAKRTIPLLCFSSFR